MFIFSLILAKRYDNVSLKEEIMIIDTNKIFNYFFCLTLVLFIYVAFQLGRAVEKDHTETAIKNAIAYCPEVKNCDTQTAINALRGMAENGYTLEQHRLCWESPEGG